MRASKGAIDNFEIDDSGDITITTIDDAPPSGICGSGIISIIGELFKKGVIDAAGKFTDKIPDKIKKDKRPYKFYVTDNITVSEADIDNFIRAKGAVFSACRTLLKNMGLTFDDIDFIYIAGGFGRYLNIEKSKTIGLLPPDIGENKIIYLGNASVLGAYKILLSEENEKKVHETSDRITYIDLSSEAGYMEEYLAALFIPHTDYIL
jgi:uncharacterized 2Fe-2S/4Fe-4S cluster protein (DUF4445 family)